MSPRNYSMWEIFCCKKTTTAYKYRPKPDKTLPTTKQWQSLKGCPRLKSCPRLKDNQE